MEEKPTLHILGMFHTICNHDYDHCAFTGKVMRFSKMMRQQGYIVIEYSNGESISEANEHVQILTKEEVEGFVGKPNNLNALHGTKGTPIWKAFNDKLLMELIKKVNRHDIIIHPYGSSYENLVTDIPYCFHTELGIGYQDRDFGAFRIYESYTWMHYLMGNHIFREPDGSVSVYENGAPRVGRWGNAYEWVVPNYYDINEWEPSYEKDGYLLYLGRVIESKGMRILQEIGKRINEPIEIIGMGDLDDFKDSKNMNFRGGITGVKNRNEAFKKARAVIMPTQYIEPFGSVAIESMISGTPVISSSFGAFTETVEHGKNGFRCHTLGDYLKAIENIETLDRKYISDKARSLYSYETVGKKYDAIFKQIYDLRENGWYSLHSHTIM